MRRELTDNQRSCFAVTDDQILSDLNTERRKFTKANTEIMLDLCAELEKRGVYTKTSTMERYGYSSFKMVEEYGAYWHTFQGLQECPKCKADLRNPEQR